MCLSFATKIFDEPSNQFHGRTIYFIKKISLDDFPFSGDYLLERVKKGMELGYTFNQCCEHWLKDFEIALYNTKIEVPEEEGAIFSYHEFLFNLQEIMLSKVILCGSILVLWSLAHLFCLLISGYVIAAHVFLVLSFPAKQWIGGEFGDVFSSLSLSLLCFVIGQN